MKHDFIVFIIFVTIIKNIKINTSLIINITILLSIVYYYYYMFKKDNEIKHNLNKILKDNLELENNLPLLKTLNEINKYYTEKNLFSNELFRKIIYYTDKLYQHKSIFYKNYLIQLLNDIDTSLNDKKFNNLKKKIFNEIEKVVKDNGPISFDYIKTPSNFEAF